MAQSTHMRRLVCTGRAYFQNGDVEEATRHWKKALDASYKLQDYAVTYVLSANLGDALAVTNPDAADYRSRLEQAVAYYDYALSLLDQCGMSARVGEYPVLQTSVRAIECKRKRVKKRMFLTQKVSKAQPIDNPASPTAANAMDALVCTTCQHPSKEGNALVVDESDGCSYCQRCYDEYYAAVSGDVHFDGVVDDARTNAWLCEDTNIQSTSNADDSWAENSPDLTHKPTSTSQAATASTSPHALSDLTGSAPPKDLRPDHFDKDVEHGARPSAPPSPSVAVERTESTPDGSAAEQLQDTEQSVIVSNAEATEPTAPRHTHHGVPSNVWRDHNSATLTATSTPNDSPHCSEDVDRHDNSCPVARSVGAAEQTASAPANAVPKQPQDTQPPIISSTKAAIPSTTLGATHQAISSTDTCKYMYTRAFLLSLRNLHSTCPAELQDCAVLRHQRVSGKRGEHSLSSRAPTPTAGLAQLQQQHGGAKPRARGASRCPTSSAESGQSTLLPSAALCDTLRSTTVAISEQSTAQLRELLDHVLPSPLCSPLTPQ